MILKFRQSIKKSKLHLKLLIIASLLAIIPVIILGIVSYYIADYNLKKEIVSTEHETMIQIQERIDQMLTSIDRNAMIQAINPTIVGLLSSYNPKEEFGIMKDVEMLIQSVSLISKDILSVHLCFSNNNYIISNGSMIAIEERGFRENANILSPIIKNSFGEYNQPYYWLDYKNKVAAGNKQEEYTITLIRRIPAWAVEPKGYLVINISDSSLFKVLSDLKITKRREMLIMSPSGNIFSDSRNNILTQSVNSYDFINDLKATKDKEKAFSEKINGELMLINYIQSPYNGWKYIMIIPAKEISNNFKMIKNATLIICFILILFSLIIATLLSRVIYSFVQNIINIIKRKTTQEIQTENEKNEFVYISNYLESVHIKNNHLEKEIHDSKPFLKASFILSLLNQQINSESILEKFNYYDIQIKSTFFTVICIELDNLKDYTEKDVNLFLFAVQNISEEIISRSSSVMAVKMQSNLLAVIINHESYDENTQNNVFIIAEDVRNTIESLLKITTTIGIGRCYSDVENIRQSYWEAVEALEYQLIIGNSTVIFIGNVNSRSEGYIYPIWKEQQVITNLKLGNIEQISKMVNEFAAALKDVETLSYENVQQSFAQLIAISLKTLYEMDSEDSLNIFNYNVYNKLAEFRTIEQIVQWMKHEFYPEIINNILHSRGLKNRSTIQTVLEYIHQHYFQDLSQYILAELVSIPPSHFSRLFKEEVGITFSDYIISYRMEKAKEFLKATDMKVGEIAEKLRYNNSQNFIRIFKHLTGSTPGEYRINNAIGDEGKRSRSNI